MSPLATRSARRLTPAALTFGLLLSAAGVGCGVSKPAGAGGSPGALTACLDRPAELPRPPATTLPCELLPPGFSR